MLEFGSGSTFQGGCSFVLKGIESAQDALNACGIGREGVVITNHARCQVNGVSILEVLLEIVDER